MKPLWQTKLQESWLSDNALSRLLTPVSWLYGGLAGLRRSAYRLGVFKSYTAPVPIIVVGSVVVGGTGKTPVVIQTVQELQNLGCLVGVVSRGYGRIDSDSLKYVKTTSHPNEVGDEPLLIYQKTGATTVVARNRVQAVQYLLEKYPEIDVVVCDDGLQHYQLNRTAEIIVLDSRGVGNGKLLPAGLLRETLSRHLNGISGDNQQRIARLLIAPQNVLNQNAISVYTNLATAHIEKILADVAIDGSGVEYELRKWKGRFVSAIAGIAQPEIFFQMLMDKGLVVKHAFAASDHDRFESILLDTFVKQTEAEKDKLPLFCTEKDVSKLRARGVQCFSVGLRVQIERKHQQFLQKIVDSARNNDYILTTRVALSKKENQRD